MTFKRKQSEGRISHQGTWTKFSSLICVMYSLIHQTSSQTSVLLKGDIVHEDLPGESASTRYGVYYTDDSTPKVPGFTVKDSIGAPTRGAGTHHCDLNLVLPHATHIMVKICDAGTKLILEEAKGSYAGFVNTFTSMTAVGDYLFKDAVPLVDDTLGTNLIVALQMSPGTGDFNLTLVNYNMNFSSHAASKIISAVVENQRITNPKLGVFCPNGASNCTLIIYDPVNSKDAPMIVYMVTLSATPTITFLTSFRAATSFINKQHTSVAVFQNGPSLFYAAVADNNLLTYAIGFNQSDNYKMYEMAGGTKTFPGLGQSGIKYFVHLTATKLNQLSVVSPSGSISYLVRVHLLVLYEFKTQLPDCFKSWQGAVVTSHNIQGLHGVFVFTNPSNNFTTGMVIYARPYDAGLETNADGRCMSNQNAKHGHIDLMRKELVEFGTGNNQVYQLQTPQITFDTRDLGAGLVQLRIKATTLATGQSMIQSKNFTIATDLFDMGLRKQQMFTKVWEETPTVEFYETEFPTHVEMSMNEVVSNGGRYKFSGDNLVSYSTGMSSPEYKFKDTTHVAISNFSKSVLLRRDMLMIQHGNSKLSLFGCVETTNRGRLRSLVQDIDPHSDRPTVPTLQNQVILPISQPTYFVELAIEYPSSGAFMISLFSTTSKTYLRQQQINLRLKSYVWRTNGDAGILYYIVENKPESLYKLTVDPNQIVNTEVELVNGRAKVCARDVGVSPNNLDEVMVYSACPGEDAYLTAFDVQSSPAVNIYQKYFKVKDNHQSLTMCVLQSNILCMSPSRSDVRLINARGHNLNLNFPANTEATELFGCLPQIGYFVSVRRSTATNKHYIVVYGQSTPEAEVLGERVQSVMEIQNLTSTEGLSISCNFERRDLSIYITLTPKEKSVNQTNNFSVGCYKVAIDVGDIVVKPQGNNKMSSLSLNFWPAFGETSTSTQLKFRTFVPALKPAVRKYQPLPKNQQGVFDFSTYCEFQGNYFGIELRGVNKDQAELRDRLRETGPKISSEFAVMPLVATAGPFVVMARLNSKMVLIKNYLQDGSRSKLTLDELEAVDEIGMVEDSASNTLLIMARRETLQGNDFVLYWVKTDTAFPSSSSSLGFYKWSHVGSFIRLNFFSTIALEGSHHHYIGSLMNEARRAVLVFTFIFDKPYSQLLMINSQIIENKHILEDVFLNRDKSWVLIKQRGSTMTIAKADRKQGDSLLIAYNEVYKPFQDAAIIAAYCTKIGNSFCIYESASRFYFTEGEDLKGSFEKIPGYRTVGWTINNNFIGLLLKSLHVGMDETITRRIAVFKRGYIGVYLLYKLEGAVDDRILGENLNNAFALLETPDGAVILVTDRLKPTNTQLTQASSVNLPMVSNKIELMIHDSSLSAEHIKLVFKSENPQNEFVRGLFVDPGIYPPSDDQSKSNTWLWVLIVLGVLVVAGVGGFLIYMYCTKWKHENKSTELDDASANYTDADHL